MKKILIILIFFVLFQVGEVKAQTDSFRMTITPPIIKNNMKPGETWVSTVKVVNNNNKEVTVYSDVQDFRSNGSGGVELISKEESDGEGNKTGFLRQWMTVLTEPIVLKPFDSAEIPFEIKVPETAEPGGHYAAILVGNKPIGKVEGSGISISSMISSLILVNIAGDIIEEGRIREFSTSKTYYKEPKVEFKFKFENTGNVHLQPSGEIVITDMFGEQKGLIDINKNTAYGNVLPGSAKDWSFSWEGEPGLFKMGRYTATVTIHYGEQTKEVDTRTFYFWYLDFKVIGTILGIFFGFLLFIFLIIKFYIRRAIKQSQKEIENFKKYQEQNLQENIKENIQKTDELPVETKKEKAQGSANKGVVDLKEIMKNKK